MSATSHPSRLAYSTTVGSVPPLVAKVVPGSGWTSAASSYSESPLAQDAITPLGQVSSDWSGGLRRERKQSSAGRNRHRRASSLRSVTSASHLPRYIREPPTDEHTSSASRMAPLSRPKLEVVTPRAASLSSGARSKMLPRQHRPLRAHGSLDLSKSRMEHESMGVATPLENNDLCSPVHHRRAGSSISQSSISSDMGWRLGSSPATFVHPMRQTPQSFTSPIARTQNSNFYNNSNYFAVPTTEQDIDHATDVANNFERPVEFRHTSFSSSLKRHPSNAVLSTTSDTASQANFSLFSPTDSSPQSQNFLSPIDTPATTRSSIDSNMFGGKKTHSPSDPDEFAAEVQRLRREYLERQRIKDEKLAAKETKTRERQIRKEEKRERKSMSRRNSKPSVLSSASEEEPEQNDEGPASHVFPEYHEGADVSCSTAHSDVAVTDATNASISTPAEYKGPAVKVARRKVSNKWGKIKFDAATFRIHMLRSMGLRTRD